MGPDKLNFSSDAVGPNWPRKCAGRLDFVPRRFSGVLGVFLDFKRIDTNTLDRQLPQNSHKIANFPLFAR